MASTETALSKIINKGEMVPEANGPAMVVCKDSLAKVKRWAEEAARAAVNQQESNKARVKAIPT